MPILDGRHVEPGEIDRLRHTFVGTFRPSGPPGLLTDDGRPIDVYACPCGRDLWTLQQLRDHWQQGHLDEPQYRTIDWTGQGSG